MNTATLTLAEHVQYVRKLKLEHTAAALAAKEAKDAFEHEEHVLFERMDVEGVQSLNVAGTNYVRAETQYGTIQDRSEFVTWAEENAPELLETKERKKLVNELVRECLDDGKPLPPGVGFYTDQYISQRAG